MSLGRVYSQRLIAVNRGNRPSSEGYATFTSENEIGQHERERGMQPVADRFGHRALNRRIAGGTCVEISPSEAKVSQRVRSWLLTRT